MLNIVDKSCKTRELDLAIWRALVTSRQSWGAGQGFSQQGLKGMCTEGVEKAAGNMPF